jgi:hypothetical protein
MRCSLTCVAGTLPKKDSRNMHRAPGGRRSALSQLPAVARGRSQSGDRKCAHCPWLFAFYSIRNHDRTGYVLHLFHLP